MPVAEEAVPVASGAPGGGVVRRMRPGGRPSAGYGWGGSRRGSRGPRPVRPVAVPVIVRPAALPRPVWPALPSSSGPRLLVRRPVVVEPVSPLTIRVRRVLGGAALTVAAAALVVGLGLLAGTVAQSRVGAGGPAPAVATVTVGPEATVQDVARGVAPAASGAQVAALTERIVTVNSLTSVELRPGQVLRVPLG
ncbi:hypothetical protein [Pseudonocardia xinjiangensis]|uniref:LysM domain-containing protein n=1 Tax=Pseudonocardia xinjiangensis TaxID=75289 RepID=A0ABX1RBA8_9PSEU|nr:hypothetical protein [Pseudonocardia xinjiangensis]NMH77076.1 hypothetical protein [Pseudonocardia xinjiangensis]